MKEGESKDLLTSVFGTVTFRRKKSNFSLGLGILNGYKQNVPIAYTSCQIGGKIAFVADILVFLGYDPLPLGTCGVRFKLKKVALDVGILHSALIYEEGILPKLGIMIPFK